MVDESKSKIEQMLKISDEILGNLETEDIAFEKVLLKCKKLARLRDDFEAMNWFTAELHGYGQETIVPNIERAELGRFAQLSGRMVITTDPKTKEQVQKYWTPSVSELEASIQTNLIALENLKPPSQFTPAVSRSSYESMYTGPTSSQFVIEKYQDVLNAITTQRNVISETIKNYKSLLGKIKNNVYNYVMGVNLQLRFEHITESIFQETKVLVDKQLAEICPDAMKKFLAAYNRLKSDNPEEWSQSMSSCRNVLKEFADFVFPAQKGTYKKRNGEALAVTEDKYKNRLLAFIDKESTGSKNKYLSARVSDLESRIHILNDLLSKGTHEGLNLQDVNICVLDTYLLIGSLLSLIDR